MEEKRNSERLKAILVRVETWLFFLSLFNFVWYFSHSNIVQEFGTTAISFCIYCQWYWEWSFTNPPTMLLLASIVLMFRNLVGYAVAALVGGFVIVDGIVWVSSGSGFIVGINTRIAAISENVYVPYWQIPDWQYLFAVILTMVSLGLVLIQIRQPKF